MALRGLGWLQDRRRGCWSVGEVRHLLGNVHAAGRHREHRADALGDAAGAKHLARILGPHRRCQASALGPVERPIDPRRAAGRMGEGGVRDLVVQLMPLDPPASAEEIAKHGVGLLRRAALEDVIVLGGGRRVAPFGLGD